MTRPATDLGVFGEFASGADAAGALTVLRLDLQAVDLIAEWSRCGVVADFAARYLAANFEDRTTAALVLSTVANELVENAAKFSAGADHPIRFEALHFGDELRLTIANVVDAGRARAFAERLEELMAQDVETLFLRRLETPTGGIGSGAGIGLMILKKDYGARIAARILPRGAGGLHDAEVQITLTSAEIEQR